MPIAVRRATADDAQLLHGFIVALAEYEREPDAVEVTPEQLGAQLAQSSPPFEALIAEGSDGALGFALYFFNYSTWRGRIGLYLEDLFVPEAHRGDGVGIALMGTLARTAVERDCARFEWAALDWNTPAIEFYQRLGAEALGDWTTFRLSGEALQSLADRA